MKLSLATFITASLFVVSGFAADFRVDYYHDVDFQNNAGFQQGSIDKQFGRPKANLENIKSIQANDWLNVVVYSGYAYQGESRSFVGSQQSVDIPFTIHSIKLYNTQV